MRHYILFHVITGHYAIMSISKEDNPVLIGLHSDWIIHDPHDTYVSAEIQFNRLVTSQKEFK